MSSRRRRREEAEERKKQKKALKKSYEKQPSNKRRVGSKRVSDTQKFILIGAVAIIMIIIVAFTFRPPSPVCYFTERDYVHAVLDQDTQSISFSHIAAWYQLRPYATSLSCDLWDYFNSSYSIIKPDLAVEPEVYANSIMYSFNNEESTLSWETIMENGTPPDMSAWISLTSLARTPPSIPSTGIPTAVIFTVDILTGVAVDTCNISLRFNKNLANTTIEFLDITNGTADSDNLIFTVEEEDLPAASQVFLNFSVSINTTLPWSELDLLHSGAIHLVLENKLLSNFGDTSAFTASELTFSEFKYSQFPEVKKSNFLDIVVDIPYFNITLS